LLKVVGENASKIMRKKKEGGFAHSETGGKSLIVIYPETSKKPIRGRVEHCGKKTSYNKSHVTITVAV